VHNLILLSYEWSIIFILPVVVHECQDRELLLLQDSFFSFCCRESHAGNDDDDDDDDDVHERRLFSFSPNVDSISFG
jgi:hypothetical protein